MNDLLIQTILAVHNSDGEDAIWMQILVLAIMAVFLGIFSLTRAKANKSKERDQNYPQKALAQESQRFQHQQIQPIPGRSVHKKLSFSALKTTLNVNKYKKTEQHVFNFDIPDTTGRTKSKINLARKRKKDLSSGMELLELNFLLRTIENVSDDDEKDVTIRKLNFKELLRRGKLNEADSNTLKIYAINKDNLYDKYIQCEAMKNLAERTASGSKHNN
jgi:hypothetical protein